jgi:hypothetical protein
MLALRDGALAPRAATAYREYLRFAPAGDPDAGKARAFIQSRGLESRGP